MREARRGRELVSVDVDDVEATGLEACCCCRNRSRFSLEEKGFGCRGFCGLDGFLGGFRGADARISAELLGSPCMTESSQIEMGNDTEEVRRMIRSSV